MQGMVMGILVTVLLLGTVTVSAATPQTIEAIFGGVRTTVFGNEFVVRNTEGQIIEPLTYNGIVYIPVNVVLHAMGANAQWNEETRTLNFGLAGVAEQPPVTNERTPLTAAAAPFDWGSNSTRGASWNVRVVDNIRMGGEYYSNAIRFDYRSFLNGLRAHSLHNLQGNFRTLTGYIGRIDGTAQFNATFNFIGDGRIIETFNLNATDLPREITVNVEGVRQLKVEVSIGAGGTGFMQQNTSYAFVGYLQ